MVFYFILFPKKKWAFLGWHLTVTADNFALYKNMGVHQRMGCNYLIEKINNKNYTNAPILN